MTPWIAWIFGLLAATLACGFAAWVTCSFSNLANKQRSWKRAAVLTALCVLPIGIEAGVQTALLQPDLPLRLSSGKIIALIYREPYQYQDAGVSEEMAEAWYLRVGDTIPESITTTLSDFEITEPNPVVVTYSGNPGTTLRDSVENITDRPQQVCTGNCDGIADITTAKLAATQGLVLADAERVQNSKIGDPAMSALAGPGKSPLSFGHWCLSIGIGMMFLIIFDHYQKRRQIRGPSDGFPLFQRDRWQRPPLKDSDAKIVPMKNAKSKRRRLKQP